MSPKGVMNVRIFEVFTSIEGEGIFVGTKTLFVRLAGCPFTCFYCDTAEALPTDSGDEYDIESACRLIEQNIVPNTFKVNFTGGEPLLQHSAVAMLARHVQSMGIPTYLESSCYNSLRFEHVLPHMDMIKIELKTADSGFVDRGHHNDMTDNAIRCLESAMTSGKKTYVKIVVSEKTSRDELERMAGRIFGVAGRLDGFVIQPTYGVAEPSLGRLLEFYDVIYQRYPDVRIVPQLHKIIGAP